MRKFEPFTYVYEMFDCWAKLLTDWRQDPR